MLTKWGGIGPGNAQFSSEGGSQGISIDSEGYVRVSDWGKREVKRFTKTGEFIDKYQWPEGQEYKLTDLYCDFHQMFAIGRWDSWPLGTYIFTFYEPWFFEDKDQFAADYIHTSASLCTGYERTSKEPQDLKIVYACVTSEHKVKKFISWEGLLNPYPPYYGIGEWGTYGTNPGQLAGPLSIVRDKNSFLYVGDETGRIQKFGVNGYFYKIVTQLDPSKKEMPLDMAIDRWGCFYVATSACRVLKFDPDWNFLTGWGRAGTGDGEFGPRLRIWVDSQANVYVCDGDWPGDVGAKQNQRIQVFTETDQQGSDVTFTGYMAEPVNTATGNFTYEHTDLTVPGPGLSFKFERFYNSQDYYEGVFGKGWHHSYEMRASEREDGSVVISWPNGHCDIYDLVGSHYVPKLPGVYNNLIKNGDSAFTLIRTDQIKYNFAINGKLQNIIDRNNNSITLSYSGTGKLRTITDAVGRQFTLAYDANGRLASLTDPIGREIAYRFDPNNDLGSVADANGFTTRFFYDSKHRITKITNPRNFTLLENTYDGYNRVVRQRDAKNNSTTFDYRTTQIETPWGTVTAYTGVTEVNDPMGYKTTHEYDGLSRLPRVVAADSSDTESEYDANDNRIAWTDEADNTTDYQYDNRGNVTRKLDPNGGPTHISYDSYNNPLRKEDALGNVATYAYDSNGNLIDTNDALGQITHREYFSNGLLKKVEDPNGNTTLYDYDDQGNLIHVTDPLGNETTYTYDGVGRKLSQKDALGQETRYEYDAADHLIAVTDPSGRVTRYEYDENGNKTREIYPDGNDKEFVYDELDRIAVVTDEAGFSTQYEYDALAHLVKVTDPCDYETIHAYDKVGNRTNTTDARGNTTTYAYDSRGNLTRIDDPNGGRTIYEYDLLNRRTKVVDPLSHQTRYEYDALGRIIRTIDPSGHSISNSYDALGRLAATTDKNGNRTSYKYDPAGNLLEVNEPNGVVTKHRYDRAGNRIAAIDPLERATTFQYDKLNRLVKIIDPLGHSKETRYDKVGRIKERIDAKGRVTTYDYDLRDRLIRVTDPAGYQTNYSYDARGNLTSMANARGKETTSRYDALNRLTKQTNPLGLARSFRYDPLGNKTALIDEDGRTTSYQYDKNNRLILETFPDGNSVRYEYDLAGRLTKMTDSIGVTTYQYDNRGSLISKTDPFGQTVGYVYDPVGNKASIAYPGDREVQYSYDQYNDLIEIRDWLSNITRYTYDLADELIGVNLPNGDITTYDYDDAGRLVYQDSETGGGQPICEYTIELDEVGNRVAIDYNQPILPSISVTEEVIDYAYDDADRLVKAGDVNYVFSNRGDLVQKRVGTSTTNYTYDSHDWLTQMAKVAEQWLYSYDGQGHRIDGTSSAGTARYTIDSSGGDMWDVLAETSTDNTPKYYYIYGLGLAYLIDAHTEEPLFYHYDPMSSTVALTNLFGSVVGEYSYDEFGKLNACSCVTSNPYQYVGKFGVATAPEGILYMRARYYDPALGIFLSRDPVVGAMDGFTSFYHYVNNTPISFIDPSGKYRLIPGNERYAEPLVWSNLAEDWAAIGLIPDVGLLLADFSESQWRYGRTYNESVAAESLETLGEVSVGLGIDLSIDASVLYKIISKSAGAAISFLISAPQYVLLQLPEQQNRVARYTSEIEWDRALFNLYRRLYGDTGVYESSKIQMIDETMRGLRDPTPSISEWARTDTSGFTRHRLTPEELAEMAYIILGGRAGCGGGGDADGGNSNTTSSKAVSITGRYSERVLPSGGHIGPQTIYHRPTTLTSVDLNGKPRSTQVIPERYEPKFRIINKSNAKDLR